MFRFMTSIFAATVAAFVMTACAQKIYTAEELVAMEAGERTAIILEQPQVNDVIAADLLKFSEFTFGGGDAFGLLNVVEVTPETIVVVTAMSAWFNPEGAIEELNGDLEDTVWDEDEKIVVNIADLKKHLEEGSIYEARRLAVK